MDSAGAASASSSTSSCFSPLWSRRTSAIPNPTGNKALYTVTVQPPGNRRSSLETRVLDLRTGTSSVFSNEVGNREASWLGIYDDVIWLRDAGAASTEIWVADASGQQESYCAGRIAARASHLRIKKLQNEYKDIAIAVACPVTPNGAFHIEDGDEAQEHKAIWYTTLRKKAIECQARYVVSPSKWVNALRGTGLESPLPSPHGSSNDFDISSSGLVFLSKDHTGGSVNFPSINVYYIPLKTFTELSKPRPQLITVRDFEGRSTSPIFSPDGGSVAFSKKKHPIDMNDRNRLIVINHIRDFRSHMSMIDTPTQVSNKEWHLSPFSIAWADNGKELYAVAIDHGIRKLFKIPAALSSITKEPEPITNESKSAADIRHLRMVFSAPMESMRP